jgi:hypothetical protein
MSGGTAPRFTSKQRQYLAFFGAYARVNRRPPAEHKMKRFFGVTPPTVHLTILTLERASLIRRHPASPAASKSSFHQRTCPS